MADGDLTTLAAVKAYLKGSVPIPSDDDALISGLVTSVSQAFLGNTDCLMSVEDITEVVDGNGRSRLFLNQYPVLSVTQVEIDGEVVPARPGYGENGWVLGNAETGRLDLTGYTFNQGVQNVVVTYQAGVAAVPADVAQAVVDQVAYLYRQKDRIGISNQSVGGDTVTYLGSWSGQQGKDGFTPAFAAVVARYRRVN